jgi:septal ring factor EnvC (AmiA/AmiB activator)
LLQAIAEGDEVAKTIAELSAYCAVLQERVETDRGAIAELWVETARMEDRLKAIETGTARADGSTAGREKTTEELRTKILILEQDLNSVRQELKLSQHTLAEYSKRADVWLGRGWTVLTVLIGALLSLASGLIVTLARRGP